VHSVYNLQRFTRAMLCINMVFAVESCLFVRPSVRLALLFFDKPRDACGSIVLVCQRQLGFLVSSGKTKRKNRQFFCFIGYLTPSTLRPTVLHTTERHTKHQQGVIIVAYVLLGSCAHSRKGTLGIRQ